MNQTVAEVIGGLGNQMFIYAFARAQQLAYGGRCVLVDRQDGPVAHAVCALQLLCISPEVEICRDADYMKTALPLPNALRSLALRCDTLLLLCLFLLLKLAPLALGISLP